MVSFYRPPSRISNAVKDEVTPQRMVSWFLKAQMPPPGERDHAKKPAPPPHVPRWPPPALGDGAPRCSPLHWCAGLTPSVGSIQVITRVPRYHPLRRQEPAHRERTLSTSRRSPLLEPLAKQRPQPESTAHAVFGARSSMRCAPPARPWASPGPRAVPESRFEFDRGMAGATDRRVSSVRFSRFKTRGPSRCVLPRWESAGRSPAPGGAGSRIDGFPRPFLRRPRRSASYAPPRRSPGGCTLAPFRRRPTRGSSESSARARRN